MLAPRAPLTSRPASQKAFETTRGQSGRLSRKSRVVVTARFDSNRGSDRSVLEAFFLGKAFAETINDRLGAAVGDLLAEIAKADAERRQSWKEFESEIEGRARAALSRATGSATSQTGQWQSQQSTAAPRTTTNKPIAPTARSRYQPQQSNASAGALARNRRQTQASPAVQEAADDVRADVASARFELQQLINQASRKKGYR